MVERRRPPGSGDGGADDYKVGYGKPPLHTRFAPGQSAISANASGTPAFIVRAPKFLNTA
jgi:hypothetical protein